MNRSVVVTGASRGLGARIACSFLARGDTVFGISRTAGSIDVPGFYPLNADVGDAAQVHDAFALIPKVDILINNAGVGQSFYALTMDPAEIERTVRTNMLGVAYCSREAARKMVKRGGRIVNVGSILTAMHPAGASAYAGSKAGMMEWSTIFAREVASYGITVNTLGMASFESDMLAEVGKEQVAKFIASLPIPRMTSIEDVMNVIDWLISDRSSFITGQTIFLGGVA